jgi:hypothetical protein
MQIKFAAPGQALVKPIRVDVLGKQRLKLLQLGDLSQSGDQVRTEETQPLPLANQCMRR